MLTEGIAIALITGGMAVMSNVIVSAMQGSKTMYRIDQLEKKVEKHNQLIERTYELEREMSSANVRIDDMVDDIREVKKKLP